MSSPFKQLVQLKPYIPYIAAIVLAAVLLCVLGYCAPGLRRKFEGFENKDLTFVMYYADWCPHCLTAKPELETLGATQTIGGKTVQIQKLEEKDIPAEIKPTIQGYPTIRLLNPDGTTKAEYEGERTTAGFLEFLKAKVA
jgi:thiol-disulfide isomerase/thioredoxin